MLSWGTSASQVPTGAVEQALQTQPGHSKLSSPNSKSQVKVLMIGKHKFPHRLG